MASGRAQFQRFRTRPRGDHARNVPRDQAPGGPAASNRLRTRRRGEVAAKVLTSLRRKTRRASRSISRVLSRATIHLGRPSPIASSGLPGSGADYALGSLFGLAPGGVCLAGAVARPRGALLPHPFTLTTASTNDLSVGKAAAVCFLLHLPWVRTPQALPGALSCGARTFLTPRTTRGCLTDSTRSLAPRGGLRR